MNPTISAKLFKINKLRIISGPLSGPHFIFGMSDMQLCKAQLRAVKAKKLHRAVAQIASHGLQGPADNAPLPRQASGVSVHAPSGELLLLTPYRQWPASQTSGLLGIQSAFESIHTGRLGTDSAQWVTRDHGLIELVHTQTSSSRGWPVRIDVRMRQSDPLYRSHPRGPWLR